jgi:peptidoglycan/xylan/chitin deacetylase (PgdA/CDA1 family)
MVLTYHKIGSQFELGITTVARTRFGCHLDLFRELNRKTVCATEAARSPCERDRVAVTFDDGYESVFTEALPEMQSRGTVGTVFVVVGAVGKHNTWDVKLSPKPFRHLSWPQIMDLAGSGFEIGSHTLSHRDLTRLDTGRLRQELATSRKIIEDHTGVPVSAISYPFGRYTQRVLDEAVEAGYTCGFTSSPNDRGNQMALGRLGVYAIDDRRSLQRKLRVRPGYRLECLKSRVIASLSLGTTLVRR